MQIFIGTKKQKKKESEGEMIQIRVERLARERTK